MEKLAGILIFCVPFLVFSQNVRVNSGNICINDNLSYEETKTIVLNDLKSEALRKAGVKEYISEFSTLNISEKNNQFKDIFYSNFLSTISGAVTNIDITKEIRGYDNTLKCSYINLEIVAKVKKYKSKTDPKFKAKIEGIKSSYKSEENLVFDVIPFKSAYINIFYVGEYESAILFPYKKNQNTFLEKDGIRTFNEFIASSENEHELGRLIIILTKDYYPFELSERDEFGLYTKTNIDDIMNWILSIEPVNRKEYYFELNIVK